MKIFYIDYENVGIKGFTGIENLKKEDKIILFIHENSSKEEEKHVLNMIKDTNAQVEVNYFKVHTKNALDFKICTALGINAIVYKNRATHYIVSHDKGYSAAVEHMESIGEKCSITPSIMPWRECTIKADEITVQEVLELYPQATKKFIKLIIKILTTSANTSQLNTNIQQNLNDREAYSKLKPLFLQKAHA